MVNNYHKIIATQTPGVFEAHDAVEPHDSCLLYLVGDLVLSKISSLFRVFPWELSKKNIEYHESCA